MGRWVILAIVLGLLGAAGIRMLTVTAWVGRKTLPVEVLVLDTQVPCPIADARVVVFRGPMSAFEGGDISRWDSAVFRPDMDSRETKSFVTDSHGRCSFEHSFFAAGTTGVFRNSGYVDTKRVWIEVSAADRPTTVVPLDRQSVNNRDIRDVTPIIVTVALNRGR